MRKTRGIYRRQAEEWSFDFVFRVIDFAALRAARTGERPKGGCILPDAQNKPRSTNSTGRRAHDIRRCLFPLVDREGQWRKDKASLESALAWLQANVGMNKPIASIDDNEVARLVTLLQRADGVSPSTVNRSADRAPAPSLTRARLWGQPIRRSNGKEHKLKEPEGIIREATADDEARHSRALRPDLRPVARFLLIMGWRAAEACGLR